MLARQPGSQPIRLTPFPARKCLPPQICLDSQPVKVCSRHWSESKSTQVGPKLAELGRGRMENSSRSPVEGLILFLAVLGVTQLWGCCGGSRRRGGCGAGRKKKKSTSIDFTFWARSFVLDLTFQGYKHLQTLTGHQLCPWWECGHEQKDTVPGKPWGVLTGE